MQDAERDAGHGQRRRATISTAAASGWHTRQQAPRAERSVAAPAARPPRARRAAPAAWPRAGSAQYSASSSALDVDHLRLGQAGERGAHRAASIRAPGGVQRSAARASRRPLARHQQGVDRAASGVPSSARAVIGLRARRLDIVDEGRRAARPSAGPRVASASRCAASRRRAGGALRARLRGRARQQARRRVVAARERLRHQRSSRAPAARRSAARAVVAPPAPPPACARRPRRVGAQRGVELQCAALRHRAQRGEARRATGGRAATAARAARRRPAPGSGQRSRGSRRTMQRRPPAPCCRRRPRRWRRRGTSTGST